MAANAVNIVQRENRFNAKLNNTRISSVLRYLRGQQRQQTINGVLRVLRPVIGSTQCASLLVSLALKAGLDYSVY